jgi:type IV pilus assembly protein PilW
MNKDRRITSREAGFSLVELMVAVTIGLILLAAISSLFVSSKRSYNTQDSLARLQENARFAMHFLTRDIRTAGYTVCKRDNENTRTTLNTASKNFTNTANIAVEGIDNAVDNTIDNLPGTSTWSPSGSAAPPDARSGTDAIAIRYADPTKLVPVTSSMANEAAVVTVQSIGNFAVNDVVLIGDCRNADVMKISGISGLALEHTTSGGNETATLSTFYDTTAQVTKFVTRVYYVKTKADGKPALFVQENGTDQELVEGVEDLQITYGIDTDALSAPPAPDGTPNRYLKANESGLTTTADWAAVRSVRIGMLVRTVDDKDADTDIKSSYDVNGTTFTVPAGDRHQRRVFLTTIQLRNM